MCTCVCPFALACRPHTRPRLFIQFQLNSIHPPAVACYSCCCRFWRLATILICFLTKCLALRWQCLSAASRQGRTAQSLFCGFGFGLRTVNFQFLRHTSYFTPCNTLLATLFICMQVFIYVCAQSQNIALAELKGKTSIAENMSNCLKRCVTV